MDKAKRKWYKLLMLSESQHSARTDWLFDRIAGDSEGWAVPIDGQLTKVPLGNIDYFAMRIMTDGIRHQKRTAITVPRLESGVGLSLATYLELNRFFSDSPLFAHSRPLFERFQRVNFTKDQRIIVITLDRTLRDYLYLSSIRFKGQLYPFSSFPLARISQNGDEIPLDSRKSTSTYSHPPVDFYHLGQIEEFPELLKNAVVLIEFPNVTSPDTLERLSTFISESQPASILALSNSFASNQHSWLVGQGFNTGGLSPGFLAQDNGCDPALPSLASSLGAMPPRMLLQTHLVESDDADRYVYRISTALKTVRKGLKGDVPEVISLATCILSTMKNLAVPMGLYEEARKLNPYIGTIKHQLNKLFANPYLSLTPSQDAIIRPIWDAIGSDFYGLYESLDASNSKYEALLRSYSADHARTDTAILFYDETSAGIFRAVTREQFGDAGALLITTLKNALRKKYRKKNILLTGLWSVSTTPLVMAQLPDNLSVLVYNGELFGVDGAIKRANIAAKGTPLNQEFLLKPQTSQEAPNDSQLTWLEASDSSNNAIANRKTWEEVDDDPFGEVDFSLYYSGEVWATAEGTEAEDAEDDFSLDEEHIGFLLLLDDGRLVSLPAEREVLVFSNGNLNGRSISPEYIQEGDILLALDREHNKEVYEELLERAEDLSGADTDVTGEWATCMKRIRKMRLETEESILIAALKMLKCERTEPTMRSWLKGTTMAPLEVNDIEKLLKLAMYPRDSGLAARISVEIEKVRLFHRKLGKKLHRKMSKQAREYTSDAAEDNAFDELLDLTTPVKIASVDGPLSISTSDTPELLVLR